ncbi:MAG TPA: hypothetical protein VN634_08650 [Candidatus Limnocylindrales bacterium]|nr:hypothetical protein [Candidatus Limnocylindrales bacterium]
MLLRREHSSPHSDIPPERRLLVALMRDAMRCIDKYRHARDSQGRRRFEQDAEWILSNDASWVYAFVRVCEALDLDPPAVRRSLGLLPGDTDRPAGRATIATIAPSALQERRLPSC